jgi:hypothetical protein
VTTLFAILAVSNPADAISLIGNYSSTNDLGGTSISFSGQGQKAVGFTLPTGSDYTLDNITLRLGLYNTTASDVALLQIYQDVNRNSTNPNGAVLQSLLFTNPISSSDTVNNFTFAPTSTFTFLANTRYWLLVDATAGDYTWMGNSPNITPTGFSGITSNGYQASPNNGTTYFTSTVFNPFDIQATVATPVPFDFDPSFGVAVLGGGWLLRKHLKKKKSTKV